jgi:tRNA 2-thiouridine synthesizing protein A
MASPISTSKKGESSVSGADLELDITGEVCPMTFVRTKLALEKLAVGEILCITLKGGEPEHNVPRSVRDHGHEILSLAPLTDDLFELRVRKCR